uniref:Uncharacterized protein n=1 Tax=uncultured marine group II/III euryarchaeote KM3_89_F04 TaxID=1456539 RepID=A0A075HVN1_9EURY|nr:hypothetical protein [uncultured marine group II/III euryarchaeote KM3_89_F04]
MVASRRRCALGETCSSPSSSGCAQRGSSSASSIASAATSECGCLPTATFQSASSKAQRGTRSAPTMTSKSRSWRSSGAASASGVPNIVRCTTPPRQPRATARGRVVVAMPKSPPKRCVTSSTVATTRESGRCSVRPAAPKARAVSATWVEMRLSRSGRWPMRRTWGFTPRPAGIAPGSRESSR